MQIPYCLGNTKNLRLSILCFALLNSSVSPRYENIRKRLMSRQSRDIYLFRMFLDHDETRGTSASHGFSSKTEFLPEGRG